MTHERSRPLRVFVSHTAELLGYPPGLSFVDAACAGIRRVDAVPVTMVDFGARQDVPLEVCRNEVLSCDVHLSLIGFRYGSTISERGDGISYIEFEFEVATSAGVPRLVFLIDDQTPVPPALVDDDRTRINRFRQRVTDGTDHLVIGLVGDPGRLEAAVSQALMRIDRPYGKPVSGAGDVASPSADGLHRASSDAALDLDSLVRFLAGHLRVHSEVIDRQHVAGILRGLEGTSYSAQASIEDAMARTANRRRKYFEGGGGVPGASEQLAVAVALVEPTFRIAEWAWGWDTRSLERLETLAREED